MGNWMSENNTGENNHNYGNGQAWTEDMRRKSAERVVGRLRESDHLLQETKPEKLIRKLLEKNNIKYISEYDCKYYLIDFYLVDFDLMIDVQGNFFHCNPVMNLENSREKRF